MLQLAPLPAMEPRQSPSTGRARDARGTAEEARGAPAEAREARDLRIWALCSPEMGEKESPPVMACGGAAAAERCSGPGGGEK